MTYEETRDFYDKLVALNPGIERKGKTMPYTSANGYMFSLLNKDGEIGIRMPKDKGKAFMEKYNTVPFKSHGSFVREYVVIPEKLYSDLELLSRCLQEGYDHVMSLPPK